MGLLWTWCGVTARRLEWKHAMNNFWLKGSKGLECWTFLRKPLLRKLALSYHTMSLLSPVGRGYLTVRKTNPKAPAFHLLESIWLSVHGIRPGRTERQFTIFTSACSGPWDSAATIAISPAIAHQRQSQGPGFNFLPQKWLSGKRYQDRNFSRGGLYPNKTVVKI